MSVLKSQKLSNKDENILQKIWYKYDPDVQFYNQQLLTRMKEQDEEWANTLLTNISRRVDELPVYFDIEKDLQFLHDDKRRFSRSEGLRMMVQKMIGFRDGPLSKDFLNVVLKFHGERFSFVDPEKPEETLLEFFTDLKRLFLKACVPESPNQQYLYSNTQMNDYFIAVHNSLFRIAKGHYFLSTGAKADERAKELLDLVKGGSSENEEFINYEEIKAALKVNKNETFTKHFKKLGIEKFGGHNTPLIRKSDFIKLKEFWKTR